MSQSQGWMFIAGFWAELWLKLIKSQFLSVWQTDMSWCKWETVDNGGVMPVHERGREWLGICKIKWWDWWTPWLWRKQTELQSALSLWVSWNDGLNELIMCYWHSVCYLTQIRVWDHAATIPTKGKRAARSSAVANLMFYWLIVIKICPWKWLTDESQEWEAERGPEPGDGFKLWSDTHKDSWYWV